MRVGELEIHLLSDGNVHVDAGGPFGLVPRALYENLFNPDPRNLIPMTLLSLLVRSCGKTILIDTGLGEKLQPKDVRYWNLERPTGSLIDGLNDSGLSPEEIDIVINTHLHCDHCGGNTVWDGGSIRPAFPNAIYLVQRMEWAEYANPDVRTRRTYLDENFTPLLQAGQAELLHGDMDVTDEVRCVVTPGHTRGHQSVVLQSGGWKGLFVGDMATYSVHMRRISWLTAYDVDPLENLSTKQRWQRWALEHNAWLFFQHDPYNPIVCLEEMDGDVDLHPPRDIREITDSVPIPLQPGG
jgi:glyoxylase-like metal-dependent hydrolase (beta-lactamase superfamily II)